MRKLTFVAVMVLSAITMVHNAAEAKGRGGWTNTGGLAWFR